MVTFFRFWRVLLALNLLFGTRCTARALAGSYSNSDLSQQVLAGNLHNENTEYNTSTSAQPFYAIAHRVLTVQGITAAINHGANALEIDMTAWSKGWWADHDGRKFPVPTWGDSAKDMFKSIAELRNAGKTIIFVWLDIKNPDYCDYDSDKWRHCSIDELRNLARDILEPVGVQVLYGFYQSTFDGRGYKRILEGLDKNEALNINGRTAEVAKQFSSAGPEKSRRIMSYGYFYLPMEFGNCNEKDYYTCTELRKASESNEFGRVFGWLLASGQDWYANKLMDTANVDGLIYGLKTSAYQDEADTRNAMELIRRWLLEHSDKRYLAGQDDKPWW